MKNFLVLSLLLFIHTVLFAQANDGFYIYSADVEVRKDDVVCVPVRVNGFDTLVAMQCSFVWNPDVLAFKNLQLYNPSISLGCANFNPNTNGRLNFGWDDPTTLGKSLPDGAVLFEVCLTGLADTDSSTFVATNISSSLVMAAIIYDPIIGEVNIWKPNSAISNSIVVRGDAPQRRDITYIQPDTMTVPLGTPGIDMPLRVFNFTRINSFDFSVNFDPTVLSYKGFTHTLANPPAPILADTVFRVTESAPGVLRVYWRDYPVVGETLADSSILMNLSFDVIGADYSSTAIQLKERLDVSPVIPFRVGERFGTCRFRQPGTSAGFVRVGQLSGTDDKYIVNSFNIGVTPNPFSVSTLVDFVATESGMWRLIVTDIAGKIIIDKKNDLLAGRNGMVIANTDLRVPGMYYVHVITDTGYAVQPIVFN